MKFIGLVTIVFGFVGVAFNPLVGVAMLISGMAITWRAEK